MWYHLLYGTLAVAAGFWCCLMKIIFVEAFGPEPVPEPRPIRMFHREAQRTSKLADGRAWRVAYESEQVMGQALRVVSNNVRTLKALDNRHLHQSLNDRVRTSWTNKSVVTLKPLRLPLAA